MTVPFSFLSVFFSVSLYTVPLESRGNSFTRYTLLSRILSSFLDVSCNRRSFSFKLSFWSRSNSTNLSFLSTAIRSLFDSFKHDDTSFKYRTKTNTDQINAIAKIPIFTRPPRAIIVSSFSKRLCSLEIFLRIDTPTWLFVENPLSILVVRKTTVFPWFLIRKSHQASLRLAADVRM